MKNLSFSTHSTLELPVAGMDCAECVRHVRQAWENLPGVKSVDVLLAAEKAILSLPDLGILANSSRLIRQKITEGE